MGNELQELFEALGFMSGFGGTSLRVKLATTEEAKETDLYGELLATMSGMIELEKEVDTFQEELQDKYDFSKVDSEDSLKATLTVDEYTKLHTIAEGFDITKQVLNHLLGAVVNDGSDVLIEVEDENYSGCNCGYCSLKEQIESEELA